MLLLAWQYECEKKKKSWIKINLSVPLKIKMSPKIFARGTNIFQYFWFFSISLGSKVRAVA